MFKICIFLHFFPPPHAFDARVFLSEGAFVKDLQTWVHERLARWRCGGDREALGELLKWQRDRAYAVAYRILGNGADAEDAVQDAFGKLLSRTVGFENLGAFKAAVYRAVVQCAIDNARVNRVRWRLDAALRHASATQQDTDVQRQEDAESLKRIFEELESMPEPQRQLVLLCYQDGLCVSEAAELLQVSRETLRDRLRKALDELRQRVKA